MLPVDPDAPQLLVRHKDRHSERYRAAKPASWNTFTCSDICSLSLNLILGGVVNLLKRVVENFDAVQYV